MLPVYHLTLSRLSRIGSFISIQAPIGAGKSWLLGSFTKVINDTGISAKVIRVASFYENENGERELLITPESPIIPIIIGEEEEEEEETTKVRPRHVFLIIEEPVKSWTEKSYSVCYKDGSMGENDATNFPSLNRKGEANILQLFGDNMKVMSSPMQTCAFTSRIHLIAEELGKIDQSIFDDPTIQIHVISERSVRTDRLFFKNLYDNNMVRGYEWEIYNSFYDLFCEELLEKENMMIYLNTSVDKCMERIKMRGRVEEKRLSREYIESLDIAHKVMIEKFRKGRKDKNTKKLRHKIFEVDFESEFHDEGEVYKVANQLLTDIIAYIDSRSK